MRTFGNPAAERRNRNSRALAVFGTNANVNGTSTACRIVRDGHGVTLYTIGYQGRDGDDLIACLIDVGVDVLADVRERPMSRRPDFRAAALQTRCEDAGIEYRSFVRLGSTEKQRDRLKATGDIDGFRKRFRVFAKRHRAEVVEDMANLARTRTIALLCFERLHEECHRSVVADLVADRLNATIAAL